MNESLLDTAFINNIIGELVGAGFNELEGEDLYAHFFAFIHKGVNESMPALVPNRDVVVSQAANGLIAHFIFAHKLGLRQAYAKTAAQNSVDNGEPKH